jgi:Uma2 family endonuclease
MSEEEYLATMTGEKPPYEFVNGEVFQKPLPKRPHGIAAKIFSRHLDRYELEFGGSWIPDPTVNQSEPGVRRYRVPDIAYWAPGRPQGDSVFFPPTLAIEILSEGQTMDDLRDKCREYRARGADVCWLVDPDRRVVEVFEAARDGERRAADDILESAHLPGFRLLLKDLWAALD